jgi:putative ABC transport system permease protein
MRKLVSQVCGVTVCGVLLLLAQIQVGMRQRRQELVVYRTLGASPAQRQRQPQRPVWLPREIKNLALKPPQCRFRPQRRFAVCCCCWRRSRSACASAGRSWWCIARSVPASARQRQPQRPVWLPREIKNLALKPPQCRFRPQRRRDSRVSLCGGWLGVRLLKGKALFRRFDAA